MRQVNVLAFFALDQGENEFTKARIVPAKLGLEAIVDHFAVVFDFADDLLELIFGQLKFWQNQLKLQRWEGQTKARKLSEP